MQKGQLQWLYSDWMIKHRVVNHFLWKSRSRMMIWKLISTLVFISTARALVILLWLDFSRKFVSFAVLCLTGVQITECASLFLFCLVVLNHCFIPVYTHSSGNAYSQLGKQSPRVSRQLSAGLAPLLDVNPLTGVILAALRQTVPSCQGYGACLIKVFIVM